MNNYIDITSALTPKRKEDGGINKTYTNSIKRILELTGQAHISRLSEFFEKTSQLEYDYSSSAHKLCSSFWIANEKSDDWSRRCIKKQLLVFLKEIGFKDQKASAVIGSAELQHRIPKENLFDDGWGTNANQAGLEWVKSLPFTSQYTLNRMSRSGIQEAYFCLTERGEKKVSKAALALLQQAEPRDRFERRGRKKSIEVADTSRNEFLERCIVNNDNLPLIDSVSLANKWSIISSNEDDLLTVVEQKLLNKRGGLNQDSDFEDRLRELLSTDTYKALIEEPRWEQLTLAL